MAYTGRFALKWVPFFRLLVYEREGILLVEVYESVGLLFRYVKRPKRAHRFILRLWKSRENVLVL